MRYLLLHALPADVAPTTGEPPIAWTEDVERRGIGLGSKRLRPGTEDTAAVVRVRGGETLVTRGPYAEVHEEIAGYDLVELPDLDEAIALAAAHPTLRHGAVEIRPLWEP
jgi:hypothetical protein